MKVEITGTVLKLEKETAKNTGKDFLIMFVQEPAPVDRFGNKFGEDNVFKVSIFNFDKNPISDFIKMIGQKVVVQAYLNTFAYTNKNGVVDYIMSMKFASMKSYQRYLEENMKRNEDKINLDEALKVEELKNKWNQKPEQKKEKPVQEQSFTNEKVDDEMFSHYEEVKSDNTDYNKSDELPF